MSKPITQWKLHQIMMMVKDTILISSSQKNWRELNQRQQLLLLASGGPGQGSALIWARPILLRYVNRYPGLLNRLSMSSSRPVSSCRMWAHRWQLNIWFTVSGSPQSRQPGSSMAPNLARSALDSEEWPVRSWFHVTSSHLLRNFFGRFFMVVAQF